MTPLLAVLIGVAAITGAWVTWSWRKAAAEQRLGVRQPVLPEARTYLHGASAGLVLMVLLVGLDNHAVEDMPRLVILFLALATGMLLFLKRQRLHQYTHWLLWLHIGLSLMALLLAGWLFV